MITALAWLAIVAATPTSEASTEEHAVTTFEQRTAVTVRDASFSGTRVDRGEPGGADDRADPTVEHSSDESLDDRGASGREALRQHTDAVGKGSAAPRDVPAESAADRTARDRTGASDSQRSDDQFLADTGISLSCALQPCPDWTADAIADFRAAFDRLPPKLRPARGSFSVLLHRTKREFGMGDGSLRAPEWTGNTFHIYAVAPTSEHRAAWRLAALTAEEQIHLWRQRAFVHAVLKRLDDELKLSERPLWRRLSGWSWGPNGLTPANVFAGAYSRSRGMATPQLDLLTFAEELFVPAEAVHENALPIDEQVRCQELSKSRALHTLLHEAKLLDSPYARPHCPAFDGWAAIDRLDSIEVLLVASSGKRPESLFGHLLMRPVHREGELVQGPSFESAIQIAAITDGESAGPIYLYRGMFGGYRTAIFTLSFRDLEREVLEGEQRTIRRFRLQLSALEQERLMERVFELERRGYYDYRFFTTNCATQVADLVQSAVDEDTTITIPGLLLASPGSALDGLASVQRKTSGESKPLLTRVNGDIEPSSVIADRAELERYDLERTLLARRPELHLETLFEESHSQRLSQRLGALRELSSREPRDEAEQKLLYRWWLDAVRVERYRVDRARTELRKLELSAILPNGPAPSTDAIVAERQTAFEHEAILDQRLMELDRADAAAEWWKKAPRRELTESERQQKAELEAQLGAFDDVTRFQGEVIDRSFAKVSATEVLQEEKAELASAQESWAARAISSSGTWRNAVGISADATANFAPLIRFESAGMRELLGDQRVRGLAATTELHVLDGSATFAPKLGWPELRESHFTLFGWRSLGRKQPSLRESLYEWFGYGFAATSDYFIERSLSNRARVDAELFALVDANATFERHLAIGLGARGEVDWASLQRGGVGGGPRVSVIQRVPLGGHSANALRLEASYGPRFLTLSDQRFAHELTAEAQVDLRVAALNQVLLVRPSVSISMDAPQSGTPLRRGTVSLVVERVAGE